MYYIIDDSRSITLPPSSLGPHFHDQLQAALRQQLEGSTSTNHDGLIVHLLNVKNFSTPRIQESTAYAVVECSFRSIVYRPFKNEIVDCIVDSIDKNGFFGWVGPMRVFISKSSMPDDFSYDERTNVYEGSEQRIISGSEVRVKIVGVRKDGGKLYAVGTIDSDYLGPSLVIAS
jgi:DNA-directed RNA polymerase II subunit RPB7